MNKRKSKSNTTITIGELCNKLKMLLAKACQDCGAKLGLDEGKIVAEQPSGTPRTDAIANEPTPAGSGFATWRMWRYEELSRTLETERNALERERDEAYRVIDQTAPYAAKLTLRVESAELSLKALREEAERLPNPPTSQPVRDAGSNNDK